MNIEAGRTPHETEAPGAPQNSLGPRKHDEARDRPRAGTAEHSGEPGSPEQVQQTLDDALADSFPASDPVSIVTSQHEEAWDGKKDDPDGSKR